MTDPLAPARRLIGQGRADLAERELRGVVADDPGNGMAHALLAACLSDNGSATEALAESEEALRRLPSHPSVWRIRSVILRRAGRHQEALAAANEALRLAPGEAVGFIRRAEARSAGGDPKGALVDIDAALAIDPANARGHDLKARLLTVLGRSKEAEAAGREALRLAPEGAGAHAALGWQLLHAGDGARAQGEFREALRLDPLMDWARLGLVESLKARNPAYRLVLRLLLWMTRARAARRGSLVGAVIGIQIAKVVAIDDPTLRPYLAPLLIAYFLLLLATWTARPLFNATLRLSRDGRYLLTAVERRESALVVACLTSGVLLAAAWPVTDDPVFALAGASTAVLSILAGVAVTRRPGARGVAAAVLGVASVPLMVTGLVLVVSGHAASALPSGLPAVLLAAPGFVGLLSRSIVFQALPSRPASSR